MTAASPPLDPLVRLHIAPFTPALLKVYLAPSVLPLAQNISYHTVETRPEKGFGYVELPAMDAAKLKKKLNGTTLKGSKVSIEEARPEKRKKIAEEADDDKPAKRSKREKVKKELGVLEGVELPDGRKVKRGWTEPSGKGKDKKDKSEKSEKKDKKEKRDPNAKKEQKPSKYTKEPELLFNAKLTPVAAAAETVRKEKKKKAKVDTVDKLEKEKKEKKKRIVSSTEAVVHEFEHHTKYPSFLKDKVVSSEPKEAVEYVNGKGWVDEDGNVVEPETGKARQRRLLELVEPSELTSVKLAKTPANPHSGPQTLSKPSKPTPVKKTKKKQATPPSSDDDESSVVSESSEDDASDSESEAESDGGASPAPSASATPTAAPKTVPTPSSPGGTKEVHPLEVLFKRAAAPGATPAAVTPSKLAPIKTSFSFFENGEADDEDEDASVIAPATPFTERDLEWRGTRSAAPTPDTGAIGGRFSFDWRHGLEANEDEEMEDVDTEAGKQLSHNTKANAKHLTKVGEDNDDDEDSEVEANRTPVAKRKAKTSEEAEDEKDESEFGKWFWENRGDNNRAWKKRRRDTMKAKRNRENRKATGGARTLA